MQQTNASIHSNLFTILINPFLRYCDLMINEIYLLKYSKRAFTSESTAPKTFYSLQRGNV